MVHVNKMIFLIHRMSGSLLRCVYRTCSYRDDYESSIYRAALVPNQKSFNVPQTGTFVDWQRDVVPWFVMWTMITDIKTKKISNSVLLNLVYTCKMKFRSSSLQRVIIHISHFDVKLAVITSVSWLSHVFNTHAWMLSGQAALHGLCCSSGSVASHVVLLLL